MMKTIIRPRKFNDAQWKALISVQPKTILSSNSKLKKDGIWNFSLPALSANVIVNNKLTTINTCQGAGSCKQFCYACSGCYCFDNTMIKHHRNLQFLLSNPFEFSNQFISEIKSKKNIKTIRFHDTGDFIPGLWSVYKSIMEACPNVQFYAYTKMVKLFNNLKANNQLPHNFTVVYSFGGIHDSIINMSTDRHSRVFKNRKELRTHSYAETYNSDRNAANPSKLRIGLIVHGSAVAMKIINKNQSINKMNNRIDA